MKKLLLFIFILSLTLSCKEEKEINPVDYVSTLVGTLSEYSFSAGNTYPATAMPWGMNFWTPQTGTMGDGWTYRYDARQIRGFKQTHQPSPWINDYGQFSIMPVTDPSKVDEHARASWFSHKTEVATPYYYSVYLADPDVNVEMTPSERGAAFRFIYPQCDSSAVVIDAFDGGSFIKVMPGGKTIVGYTVKNSGGVPENFKNWFVVNFEKEVESVDLYDGKTYMGTVDSDFTKSIELSGDHAIAVVKFSTSKWERVEMQVASSFISEAQAYTNLKEVHGKSFQTVQKEAKDKWNEVLGRIKVSGGSEEQYRTFYSCLYRSLLFPRKFYEISEDGQILHYSPYDGGIHEGYLYTDTGFWDTFRSLFPLLNLVYPSVNAEIQQGLANIARQNAFLPEWASPGHRDCMIGNNSASVVADAYMKDLNTEYIEELYEALVYATENVHPQIKSTGRYGHEYYNSLGYIPYDVGINENVARTLEYAYNDWCMLQIAKKLGRPQEEIDKWAERALNYRNVFDSESKLMRGRNEDGSFQEPFSPYKWGDAFTEGNAWHYTWSVFHDIQGLIDLMGGEEEFFEILDSAFKVPPIYDDSYYGVRIHEITEMQVADMGNYAHGNQPAQHMIYLYNYTPKPWRAQFWARKVMDKLYSATPDGYCGDEDNGQTSAWYVFSALGFYPVCPASDEYLIGSPLFREAQIQLENGKTISIKAKDNAPKAYYIESMSLNGKKYDKHYLKYEDLVKGARIKMRMSQFINKERGRSEDSKPYSFSRENSK